MTFKSRELSVLAYANGFTLWHYRIEDPLDLLLDPTTGAFEDAGYFGAACDLLCAGDQITVNLNGRPTPAIACFVVQSVNPGGQVRVAPIDGDPVARPGKTMPAELAA
ncbi:MAG: hypothetical protein WEC00_06920 [Dongiaceae bacterium]